MRKKLAGYYSLANDDFIETFFVSFFQINLVLTSKIFALNAEILMHVLMLLRTARPLIPISLLPLVLYSKAVTVLRSFCTVMKTSLLLSLLLNS